MLKLKELITPVKATAVKATTVNDRHQVYILKTGERTTATVNKKHNFQDFLVTEHFFPSLQEAMRFKMTTSKYRTPLNFWVTDIEVVDEEIAKILYKARGIDQNSRIHNSALLEEFTATK